MMDLKDPPKTNPHTLHHITTKIPQENCIWGEEKEEEEELLESLEGESGLELDAWR